MNNTETTVNHEKERPVFSEPISADIPRRQFDRKILESYDADHERVRAISSRLTRIEAVFESFQRDMQRLDKHQADMLVHTEQTASSMAAVANKLAVHCEMEEFQWQTVNKSNANIEALSMAFNEHIASAKCFATRVDWLERILFGLCGALGTLLLSWIATKMMGIE